MLRRVHRHTSGFTLTEMAIVLAIVGVLIAGLWNLISGASQQSRDSATASQQTQLINAVKGFLLSPQGQQYMIGNASCGGNCNPNQNFLLPLPATNTSVNNCQTGNPVFNADPNLQVFCTFLPPGFTTATVNSYGQTYGVRLLRDATPAGTAPTSYSFMILTAGGAAIPDSSGGRISALIGGDGGFIYTGGVCTAAPNFAMACGSYGGWQATVTGYGFAAAAGGLVASRTYISPQQSALSDWLARIQMPGDTNFVLNTMTTAEYLGGQELNMGFFANPLSNAGGGVINLQGGAINFNSINGQMNANGGAINLGGGIINIQAGRISGVENPQFSLDLETTNGTLLLTGPGYNSFIYLLTRCSVDSTASGNDGTLAFDPTCVPAMQDHGDAFFGGRVNVNSLYATTFIYQGSDIRLKTNIHPLADPLADIMKLKPVTFTYRNTTKDGIGVIAQDVEKVYPQLVSDRGDGIKSVNYDGFIAPLIGAVQELKQENEELRHELDGENARERLLEKKLKDKSAE